MSAMPVLGNPISLLKCGLVAKCVCLFAVGSVQAENRQQSLVEKLGRPATVAGHNSPSAFVKYLNKENEQKTVLVPSREGSDPFEADVWVLFFQNEAEVRSMPKLIREIYDAIPKVSERPAARYIEFQLSIGTPKAASFHFFENYGNVSEDIVACKAAIAVYSSVVRNSNSQDRKTRTEECETLMVAP